MQWSLLPMPEPIEEVLRKYWGFGRFLPLQKQAMDCVCRGRDSIVVLPTGGGKSLCFQAPALVLPLLTLVASPLIALMKDQIDSLLDSGVPAGRLDDTMSHPDRNDTYDRLRARQLKFLYVSPERLLMQGFLDFLKQRGISSVAINEAHCNSMWGHDFRPEYRKLSVLRDALPGIPIGAYTATATEAVQKDIIVATVAFGMGIDKSNVRYVIHAAMPKSLEHYQQESGRAGRDGLEAECSLFFSGADYLTWKRILEDSEPQMLETGAAKLGQMYRYCTGASCRHRTLLQYFNQNLEKDNCGACDICLAEVEGVPDALVLAQKILSGILRQGERFGADYTAAGLTGSREDRILANRHDKLSTYGLLKESGRSAVRDWIEQLADQEYIQRSGDYGVLRVTEKDRLILKGHAKPLLLEPSRKKPARKTHTASDISESVDPDIIEALRKLRIELARQRRVPAYIIFGDATLRDLASKTPSTLEELLRVSGIGGFIRIPKHGI